MIKVFKRDALGHFKNEWLDSYHHFSFGEYHNPKRVHFNTLRVINDDKIAAGKGFDFHPHKDMEIITYVRSGTIIHKDNLGNEGRTGAGDVQIMSAGKGIMHAEFSDPEVETTLFQIWIFPNEKGIEPRWEQAAFDKTPVKKNLKTLVSGNKDDQAEGALYIHQDAALYGGRLAKGSKLTHKPKKDAYLLVSEGTITVNGESMAAGDGAEIREEKALKIKAETESEILLLEV